jgi:hypothetical protein
MVLLISIIALSATAAEPNLKEIMQGLRDDVVEITDGLLTDDFTKVARCGTGCGNGSVQTNGHFGTRFVFIDCGSCG